MVSKMQEMWEGIIELRKEVKNLKFYNKLLIQAGADFEERLDKMDEED